MTDSTEQITDLIHFQLVVMDQTFTERIYHKTITIMMQKLYLVLFFVYEHPNKISDILGLKTVANKIWRVDIVLISIWIRTVYNCFQIIDLQSRSCRIWVTSKYFRNQQKLWKICHNCVLKGNAYENAIQSSVTVHGTHESTVDQNVMYNRPGIPR